MPAEYADVHFIFGICDGNSRVAVEEYQRCFLSWLLLLMEDMPPETKHGVIFQHDGAPTHFGNQIMAYLNQHYEFICSDLFQ
jgi:hypothetical protein